MKPRVSRLRVEVGIPQCVAGLGLAHLAEPFEVSGLGSVYPKP